MSTTNQPAAWAPRFIDIEVEFTQFVATFRGGAKVSNLVERIPEGTLNADFYFTNDNVIAELKCLGADAADPASYAQRVAACYRHFGYSPNDLFAWLTRAEPMPDRVARRLSRVISRSISESIRKANKQIGSTKRFLGKPDARGLVLIANDRNLAFSPAQMMAIVCGAYPRLNPCHADCIVYFAPNVYHNRGDGIAYSVWVPAYDVGSETFAAFVNELGRAWGDYEEALGDPYVYREAGDDLFEKIASARPITEFKRP